MALSSSFVLVPRSNREVQYILAPDLERSGCEHGSKLTSPPLFSPLSAGERWVMMMMMMMMMMKNVVNYRGGFAKFFFFFFFFF